MENKVKVKIKTNKTKLNKNWCKLVTRMNFQKQGGYMFEGVFLGDGYHQVDVDSIIVQVEYKGKNNSFPVLYAGVVNSNGKIDWFINFYRVSWHQKKKLLALLCDSMLSLHYLN
jgi:hypothetical protein